MWAQKSCIICYGLTPTSLPGRSDSDADANRISPETLTRFFKLLGRHLDGEDEKGQGEPEEPRLPFLQQILERGMLICCGECSKLVESFCQLYQQLKAIELQVNRRVEKLSEVMEAAQGVPAKIEEFRATAMVLDLDEFIADEVIDFKGGLVKKCTQKLKASLPRASISKCRTPPPQRREGHRAPAEGSSILIPKMEFEGHSPGSVKDEEVSSDDDVCIIEDVEREPPVKVIKLTVIPPAPTPTPATGIRSRSTGIKTYSLAKINKRTPTPSPHTHMSSQLIQMDSTIPAGGDTDLKGPSPAVPKVEPPLVDIEYQQSPKSRSSTPTQLDNDSNHVFATQSTGGDAVVQSRGTRPRKTSTPPTHKWSFIKVIPPEAKSELENGKLKYNYNRQTDKYACVRCSAELSSPLRVEDHFQSAHLNIRYQCLLCGSSLTSRWSCRAHHQSIHGGGGEGPLECYLCKMEFTSKSGLLSHLHSNHSLGERHPCQFCSRTFALSSSRNRHERDCPEVSKDFSMTTVENTGKDCDNVDNEMKNSLGHIPDPVPSMAPRNGPEIPVSAIRNKCTVNSETSKFECSDCSMQFAVINGFIYHYQSKHLKMRYKCPAPLCQKTFSQKNNYNEHYQSAHSGVRYKCMACLKTFGTQRILKEHQQAVHGGIRYECKVCLKSFSNRSSRDRHLKLCLASGNGT